VSPADAQVTAVVGANWGDEGKGKLIDYFAEHSDFVVRFQGGSNAGHTVINDFGKFALHLVPCGVFYPHTTNVLGPGVGVNIEELTAELEGLRARGVPNSTVVVSDRAQVVLPYHIGFDQLEEERLGTAKFGSTQSGMAPFYADKYLKVGVRVADLFDAGRLESRLQAGLATKNALLQHLYGKAPLAVGPLAEKLFELGQRIQPLAADTTALLHNALADGKRIMLEGQLGALRDPDHGIYPFSTSSSTLAGFATVGAGIPPQSIGRIVATVKAYSSCVGAGPFVTELANATGDELRERGGDEGEYGAKTGRPRRVGWFDAVATRYGCRVQGATEIALTLLDVLGYMDEIPTCIAYEIDGSRRDAFPVTGELDRATPVLEVMPGWKSDISEARDFGELPQEARDYVRMIETHCAVPVSWISVGPRREQTIRMADA
jgi:adenylosuccinate synthase